MSARAAGLCAELRAELRADLRAREELGDLRAERGALPLQPLRLRAQKQQPLCKCLAPLLSSRERGVFLRARDSAEARVAAL